MSVTPDGNVGIGTGTTEVTAKLHIEGAFEPLRVGDNNYYFFAGANRGGGDYVDIGAYHVTEGWKSLVLNRGGGNVGIGTDGPDRKLHVDDATSSLRFGHEGGPAVLRIENSGAASLTALNLGNDARDWQLRVEGAEGNTFKIFDATAIANRLTIDTSGNVGIGVTIPQQALSINSALNVDQTNANNGSVNPGITFGSSSGEGIASKRTGGGNQWGLDLYTASAARLSITNGGNVGIGNPTPAARLSVNGDVEVTGDIRLLNADCAEEFDVSEVEDIKPGTVMVIDEEGAVKGSQLAYDKRVAGVISGASGFKPGIILDKQGANEGRIPVALLGKVACKVDAQYSPIEVGDLLTTSPTPGHAMKADDPHRAFGSVIGKAMRPLNGGRGIIPVLAALQ
jgi:hypothetical protein